MSATIKHKTMVSVDRRNGLFMASLIVVFVVEKSLFPSANRGVVTGRYQGNKNN
ncbi:hypothetical protein [Pseudomonas syringae]|uniref:hypothetical protein n=1 Tax=Pseudomonas syringae TaxID=317 RepID=UPI001604EF32|nr:hypothetical protein [Pseudomonas syringae]